MVRKRGLDSNDSFASETRRRNKRTQFSPGLERRRQLTSLSPGRFSQPPKQRASLSCVWLSLYSSPSPPTPRRPSFFPLLSSPSFASPVMSSHIHKPNTDRAVSLEKTSCLNTDENPRRRGAHPPTAQQWDCGRPASQVGSGRGRCSLLAGNNLLTVAAGEGASRQRRRGAPGARVGSGDGAGVRLATGPASGLHEGPPRTRPALQGA